MVELTQRVTLNTQRALRVPSASHAGSPSTQSTFFGEAGAGGLLAGASMTAMQSVEAEPPPPTTTAHDERTPAVAGRRAVTRRRVGQRAISMDELLRENSPGHRSPPGGRRSHGWPGVSPAPIGESTEKAVSPTSPAGHPKINSSGTARR